MKPSKNKDKQNEILLFVGMEIARVRGKEDMLHLLCKTIRQYINFDGIFIFHYDIKSKSTKGFIYDKDNKFFSENPDLEKPLKFEYFVDDDNTHDSSLPAAHDVELLMLSKNNQRPFLIDANKAGIKEYVSIKLIERNKLVGHLLLVSEKKSSFTTEHLNLLQLIKNPIAIATANIIANLEIVNREEEKAILLSLSNQIARVRDKEEFLHILTDKLKELFPVTGFGITLLNHDGKTHSPFVVEGYLHQDHVDYKKVTTQKYNVEDGVFDKIITAGNPAMFEVDKIGGGVEAPDYVNLWRKKGIKTVLGVPLRVSNTNLGCLILHLDANFKFDISSNLLKGVCAQISVAVSNIRANEEIAKREEEKLILLSLSNEIAAIQNRKDFFEVVNARFKSLFDIREFGIAQINSNGKTYSAFVLELEKKIQSHTNYSNITSAEYLVADSVFSTIMSSKQPVLFDVDQIANAPQMPAYVGFWKKVGLKKVLGIALRESGKNIGCVFLHIDSNPTLDIKSKLLSGVCAQIAVKISDILGREEIEKRKEEKSKLLSFSNALASIADRKELSLIISQELRKFGLIGSYGISIMMEDKNQLETILYGGNDDSQNDQEYEKILNTSFKIREEISGVILMSTEPVTFKIKELIERKVMLPCLSWWDNTGISELTGIAIKLGDKRLGFVWLAMAADYDKESNYPLLKSISSQIGIALSSLLANEKILSQLNEIKKYKEQLEEEIIYLQEEINSSRNYSEIIGEGKEIKKVFRMIEQVAHSDSTVLLLGETGTGKELIARAIHNNSQRRNKLMVKVNCAALPANLIESELFGHEKGSFTGAIEQRIGKFELANNGTLFLDEIGEISMDMQVKLLRALQEKEIERVGGKTTIKTDARIIAATNRDLEKLMEEGKFRSDLYYRLNIFPIVLPPLRNRRDDIPELTSYFIRKYSKKAGKKIKTIHNKAMQHLMHYDWPGNIRELEHLIERSVLLTNGDTIKEINLTHKKKQFTAGTDKEDSGIKTIDQNEKEYILKVLKHVNGKIGGVGGAAELLGLPTSTLNSRMKRLGIRKEHIG